MTSKATPPSGEMAAVENINRDRHQDSTNGANRDILDEAVLAERSLLGGVILEPDRFAGEEVGALSSDDFLLTDHRAIWQCMNRLHGDGIPFDLPILVMELDGKVEAAYLCGLLEGVVPENVNEYVRRVRKSSRRRTIKRIIHLLDESDEAEQPRLANRLVEVLNTSAASGRGRQWVLALPEIEKVELPPVEHIVPALDLYRGVVATWSGPGGSGKSMLAEAMAVEVARGGEFLGQRCTKVPVLILDMENIAQFVQMRLRKLIGCEPVDGILRVCGRWVRPDIRCGSDILLAIAEELKPLIVIDPLVFFHTEDEKDPTGMARVMDYLRQLASKGAAVVDIHHVTKADPGVSRGASVIVDQADVHVLHSFNPQENLIELQIKKSKNGAMRRLFVRADLENAAFTFTDSPVLGSRNERIIEIQRVIEKEPGITLTKLRQIVGGDSTVVGNLLEQENGASWEMRPGPKKRTKTYFPLGWQGHLQVVASD